MYMPYNFHTEKKESIRLNCPLEFRQRESDPNMRSTLNSIYRSIRQMRLLISYNDMRMKLFIAIHTSWATFLFSLLVPFEYHVKTETLILEYDNLSPWKQYLSNSPSLAWLNLCFVITANVFFFNSYDVL